MTQTEGGALAAAPAGGAAVGRLMQFHEAQVLRSRGIREASVWRKTSLGW